MSVKKNNKKGGSCCPFSKNQIVELTIDDIGNDGEGIGHIDGYALFVKGALPGDYIKASIMKANKNYGFARIIDIITPSPDRVSPACSHAGRCGGCTLQHLDYKKQLEYKENKVKNCLIRIGGFDAEYINGITEPILGMDNPYNYRNKAQFPVGKGKDGRPVIGFYAQRSHDIIDSDSCCIQSEISNDIAGIVRAWMTEYGIEPYDEAAHTGTIRHIVTRSGFVTGEVMVCLVTLKRKIKHLDELVNRLLQIEGMTSICLNINTEKTNRILGDEIISVYGKPYIEDYIGEIRYRISPLSFYQVNPVQTEKLYGTALEYAALTGNETVWDLYCGIGTISLFLARNAKNVLGVEIVPQAIVDAEVNAKINGIDNAMFIAGASEEVCPSLAHNPATMHFAKPDVIVVDPPRKGCDGKLLDTILEAKPERVVYVSCDPATLARDLKILCESEYKLERVRACDMFGMSGHVETCVLLTHKDIAG